MCIGIVLRNGGDSLAIVRENERKKEYLRGYIYSMRKAQRLKEQIDELMRQYADEEIDGATYAQKMMELTSSAQNDND